MNNLLRTLTESNVKPHTDLRLLLTTVREGRKQSVDNKLSDPFYDALEGLLADLKTITLDNRDSEAFLKPVSKAEVPDYYDVIANPMDFQTMQRKVKGKQYKSKREFKDDLDLIWSNCFTYNASENHPLRQCVKRLKAKADRLLKHITDRRERTDPVIPPELGAGVGTGAGGYPKVNGTSSGRTRTRSPSYSSSKTSSTPGLATVKSPSSSFSHSHSHHHQHQQQPTFRLDVPFPETPAITRTAEGMMTFYELDKEVAAAVKKRYNADSKNYAQLLQKLRQLVPASMLDDDNVKTEDMDMTVTPPTKEEDPPSDDAADGIVGDKRKPSPHTDDRPRKRARFAAPRFVDESKGDDISELWWAAAQSDLLLANGIPPIPFGPSSSTQKPRTRSSSLSSYSLLPPLPSQPSSSSLTSTPSKPSKRPTKKLKLETDDDDEIQPTQVDNPQALLNLMNTNIKTMRRVRHTHAKFAALNATTMAAGGEEAGEDGAGPIAGPSHGGGGIEGSFGGASATAVVGEDDILNERVDEKPWVMMLPGTQRKGKSRSKGKGKGRERIARVGGVEVGEKNAWECVQWANQKVLEHVGFQGTSQVALDVLAGVMTEYLSNVGRIIHFMCEKYSTAMTPEEIILHTLFEGGNSKVQDLERYIRDDVERYSTRLNELEKKIVGAYRETTAGEVLEDEGLFEEEDEEETGALAVGEFADLLGEDYLGLRELGIAAEFGMTNLSIPRKLLKSKKAQLSNNPSIAGGAGGGAAKANEPPPLPYPLPPAFVPLTSGKVEEQIGLLKGYYMSRITALAAAAPPPPPRQPAMGLLPGPSLPGPVLAGPKLTMPSLSGPSLSHPQLPPPALPSVPAAGGLPSSNAITVPGASSSTTALTPAPGSLSGPTSQPPGLPLPPSTSPSQPPTQTQNGVDSLPTTITLADDVPSVAQTKMGPLGQIVTKGGSGGAGGGGGGGGSGSKKKSKAAAATAAGSGSGSGNAGGAAGGSGPPGIGASLSGGGAVANEASSGGGSGVATATTPGASAGGDGSSPKKKKAANPGVGTGHGRKKKGSEGPPGSSTGGGSGGGGTGGQGSPSYPPVVVASA